MKKEIADKLFCVRSILTSAWRLVKGPYGLFESAIDHAGSTLAFVAKCEHGTALQKKPVMSVMHRDEAVLHR